MENNIVDTMICVVYKEFPGEKKAPLWQEALVFFV